MAGSVVAGGQSGVRARDLHVQLRVAYFLAQLLQHAHAAKHRVGGDKRDLPAGRQAGGYAARVLLRDAYVHMLQRQRSRELRRPAGFPDIRVHHINVGVLKTQLQYLIAVSVPCRQALIGCQHVHPSSSSRMARANCSSSGAMPCQAAAFSMKETPFPLTVWATTHLGFPSLAPRILSSTPSISRM